MSGIAKRIAIDTDAVHQPLLSVRPMELPHIPLTDAVIKTPSPAEKTDKLFDVNGLYLDVSAGGGKSWRLKYRLAGREKRLSLGTYPHTTS